MAVSVTPTPREWLSFKQIERETDIPITSLRRFAERFKPFLPSRRIDRANRFHRDTLPVFVRIQQLYRDGKNTGEVLATLAVEYAATHDAGDGATVTTTASRPAPVEGGGVELLDTMKRIASALEVIAARLDSVAGGDQPPTRPIEATEDEKRPGHHGEAETPPKTRQRRWWHNILGGGGHGE